MKRATLISVVSIGLLVTLLVGWGVAQRPVRSAGSSDPDTIPPLYLRTRIALPGVYGRMDHYGLDTKRDVLMVSALGNNTVELISNWKRVHAITGFEHPQGSLYVPGVDRIVVSDQAGKVRFYDAESYKLLKTLDFGNDADTDNLRYDPAAKRVYVGFGEGETGAIGVIDPATMEHLKDFKLGSHAESFQMEKNGTRVFVNLPDQESFGVIDRKTGVVTKWKIPGIAKNHSLALDEVGHRLFTAELAPPGGLTVVDTESGRVVAHLPCVMGVDDVWFDAPRKRIYAPGSGFIDVFQQVDPDHYTSIAHVPVGSGAGSTSLLLPESRTTEGTLYMSWPNMLPQGGSEVLLFYVGN
jgi:DNA-binding beta-propeller fold protein YncE